MLYQYWDFTRSIKKNVLPFGLITLLISIVFFTGLILTHFIANSPLFETTSNFQVTSNGSGLLERPDLLGDSAGLLNPKPYKLELFGNCHRTTILKISQH